jgi:hypothetical protein
LKNNTLKQNIVEGWKRSTTYEYYNFLSFSLGSLGEIRGDVDDLYQDHKIKKITFEFFINKIKELDYLLNRLRESLKKKMEREGSLPQKEKYLEYKKEINTEDEVYNKLLADAGLIRLENGRVIKRGEKGEGGST